MADLRRKWSTIPKAAPAPTKQRHFTINRYVSTRVGGYCLTCNAYGSLNSPEHLSPQRLGEPDQFVCESFDAPDNFLVGDIVAVETFTGGEHKPGNNHATKVQH